MKIHNTLIKSDQLLSFLLKKTMQAVITEWCALPAKQNSHSDYTVFSKLKAYFRHRNIMPLSLSV